MLEKVKSLVHELPTQVPSAVTTLPSTKGPTTMTDFSVDEARAVSTAIVRVENAPMNALEPIFDATFAALGPLIETAGISPMGAPFAMYSRFSDDWQHCDIEVGVPVEVALSQAIEIPGADGKPIVIEPSELPGGKVATMLYVGAYDGLKGAWESFTDALTEEGYRPDMPCWEVYLTEPTPEADPNTMRTGLNTRVE